MMSDVVAAAAIAAVPAMVAAVAAWRAAVHTKRTMRQVRTSNGSTIGHMVERLDRTADLTRRAVVKHLVDVRGHNTPPDLDIVEALLDDTPLT